MATIMVALLLAAHGIGHLLFLANSWGIWKTGTARAALFGSVLNASQTAEGVIGLVWLIPLIGFLISAWGYASDTRWWRTAALVSALISTALIILWWNGLNMASAFPALVFDTAVAVILLWQQNAELLHAANG